MKKSRFCEEQVIAMIKEQHGGIPTAEICRKLGVIVQIHYKSKLGGQPVSGVRKLKAPEDESEHERRQRSAAHGRRIAKGVKPVAKPDAVAHPCDAHGVVGRPVICRKLTDRVCGIAAPGQTMQTCAKP